MRWLAFILLFALPLTAQVPLGKNPAYLANLTKLAAPGGGGGGAQAFSDDFNRADADSLGANWTEFGPDTDIASNQASAPNSFGNESKGAAYTGTACSSVNQYVKITIPTDVSKAGALLRYTDASTECYAVRMDLLNDIFTWDHLTSPAGTASQIGFSSTLTLGPGDVMGVTITGTGNSTVIRVWINPTGLPVSASNWDGDTTPDHSFTDDPADAVDTGNYVGIQGVWSGGVITWDNFFGGDIP